MYQKNSPKFASNIHCEADANDEDALWLCEKALHGTEVTGSLQGKQYKTFLLAGELGGSSFKLCPENAVCNDEGQVTGCESGYYQEEQTCKQEKACDEASKTIRTSCAEDCGEEVKEGTCNVKTGQWENYTVTQACPTKPPLTKACSALGKGWSSGTAQGSTQCSGGSWAEPTWDEEPCQKECDSTKEYIRTTCDENCGEEIKQGTCNTKTGEWENYTVTQECPVKPDDRYICHDYNSNQCGIKTRTVTCGTNGQWINTAWQGSCKTVETLSETCGSSYSKPNAKPTRKATCQEDGTWKYGAYNYTACGCTMSTKPADYTDGCNVAGQIGTKTYTYVCNYNNKWTAQLESSNCTTVPAGGTFSGHGNYCHSGYSDTKCSGGYTFTDSSQCQVGGGAGGCNGNEFQNQAYCYVGNGAASSSCNNGIYSGGAYCQTVSLTSCTGNTFKAGSRCVALKTGACGGNIYENGAYCAETTGTYGKNYCAAGTPTKDGKCWDGSGGKVAC